MSVRRPVYLDNHATTRCDPRVVDAMLPFFGERFGNAASHHAFGLAAADAVDEARAQVADLIAAEPREIVFTSGATESDNLALKGAFAMLRRHGERIVVSAIEHRAVLDVAKRLGQSGADVVVLPVDRHGRVDPDALARELSPRTVLVSVMLANNEIGTVQPIAEVGRLCKRLGVLLHVDAAQATGKLPIDVNALGVDLMSLSAHKMHGPQGVGALYVRRRDPAVRLEPLFDGGGHERGMRSGTVPVALVVGFGKAAELARREMPSEAPRLARLRDRLWDGLRAAVPDVALNGHPTERLPNNLNVSFADVRGDALLMALRDVAASSGSACTSASVEPSYVLRACGLPDDLAHASLRFGLGRFNDEAEIDFAIREVAGAVARLRDLNPTRRLAPAL